MRRLSASLLALALLACGDKAAIDDTGGADDPAASSDTVEATVAPCEDVAVTVSLYEVDGQGPAPGVLGISRVDSGQQRP